MTKESLEQLWYRAQTEACRADGRWHRTEYEPEDMPDDGEPPPAAPTINNGELKYGVYGLLYSRCVHWTNAEKLPETFGHSSLLSVHKTLDEAMSAAGLKYASESDDAGQTQQFVVVTTDAISSALTELAALRASVAEFETQKVKP